MKKRILMLLLSNVIALMSFAQSGQVKVKVIDALTNKPLSGTSVQVKGKTAGTTNEEGELSLECADSAVFSVSYIGYETVYQTINCGQEIQIALSENRKDLDEIEVTATSNPNKSQLEQPASIVKLSEVELKRGNGLFLDDAINTNTPGVFMEKRTISAGQQFNIRGYGNGVRGTNGINSNFDGQGSKVYLNGIPITDAEGITVMDDIDFASIGNVEISKGPSGTLYGLAIAGVVNMQTKKAEKGVTSLGLHTTVGSYGLFRSTASVAVGTEKSSLLINYGRQQFDGYMPHTASHKDFVNVMGDHVLNEKQSVTTYIGFSDSYDQRNGELTKEQYDTFDYSGNPAYIKNNAHSGVTSFRAGFGHTYKFTKNFSNTTSVFGSTQSMNNSSAGGWTDKSPLNYGFRSTFDVLINLSDKVKLSSITGLEMQKMNALTNGYKMGADSTNLEGYNVIKSLSSIKATTTSTASYFTQWSLLLPKDFTFTAGIGYSTMYIGLEDRLWGLSNNTPTSIVPQEYHASYTDMLSPSLALNKKINDIMSVYASYTVGYKAPVSSYFYIPTTNEVNEGLKPEKGTQIELGTKGSVMKHRLFYTLAVFNAKFSDKMTTVTVQNPSNTATLYSYVANGGSLNNNGLEVLLKYTLMQSNTGFIKAVKPFANFTYSDFKYENFIYQTSEKDASKKDSLVTHDFSGNAVAGVPKVVFNVGVDVETRLGLYGNVNYNYRGEMYYTSDQANQTSSYDLLNAKLGFRKRFNHFDIDLYAGANNITSNQYYYMVFLNQLPDAYLAAPREINYFGGVNLKYLF